MPGTQESATPAVAGMAELINQKESEIPVSSPLRTWCRGTTAEEDVLNQVDRVTNVERTISVNITLRKNTGVIFA